MTRVRGALRTYAGDVLVVTGLVLVALGAALYSPPLGPIILGLGLIASVRLGSR